MKITEAIARHLLEVHSGENWTDVWISRTLEDVSLDEAVKQTPASPNTIASLLYHITFYNRVVESRLQGTDPFISEANGYDRPPLHTEADWQQLREDNQQSARSLAEAIRQVKDEVLEEPVLQNGNSSAYYYQLHGVVEHAHYHLGQIVLLKNLIRNS